MRHYEIYGEVILGINLVMDFTILWLTAKFAQVAINKKRLFAGALVGALYALAMFLPNLSFPYSMLGKLLFSLLILLVSFAPIQLRKFLTIVLYFYMVSFSLIGIAVGVSYYINNYANVSLPYEQTLSILNQYFWPVLLITILTGYLTGRFGPLLMKRKIVQNFYRVSLTIFFADKSIQIEALIDTGNNLKDPVSQMPVMVVEYGALQDVLPQEIRRIFAEGGELKIDEILNSLTDIEWSKRLRLIPYNSLGRQNGLLLGFRPDEVEINTGNKKLKSKNIIVGVHHQQLCPEGSYQALLHPDMLQAAV